MPLEDAIQLVRVSYKTLLVRWVKPPALPKPRKPPWNHLGKPQPL